MTFIKITDPKQREALARELAEVKQSIRASNLQHRLDKLGLSRDLSKVFKPVVEAQKEAASQITRTIEDLPAQVPALPPPPAFTDPLPIEEASGTTLGSRTQHYLKLSMTPQADHTFGLRSEDDGIFIGNALVTFEGDDIFVDGVRYKGTPGLWELLVKKRPEDFEPDDLDAYEEILLQTNAIYQGNDPLSKTPKANRSYKWKGVVSHIYKKAKSGSGLEVVFLPCNLDELLDRLDLCAASYRAGNNGVRNEIVAILDTLKRRGYLDGKEYKQAHRRLL